MKIFKSKVGLIHVLSYKFGETVQMAQMKQNKSTNSKTKANQELVIGIHGRFKCLGKKKKKELSSRIMLLLLNLLSIAHFIDT